MVARESGGAVVVVGTRRSRVGGATLEGGVSCGGCGRGCSGCSVMDDVVVDDERRPPKRDV